MRRALFRNRRFCNYTKSKYCFLQNCILQKLEEFNISYNWLGDSAGSSLAAILSRCPVLNTLRIECCGLTSHVTAHGKEFSVALKGKDLKDS